MNLTRSIYSKSPYQKANASILKENYDNNSLSSDTKNYPKTDVRISKPKKSISNISNNSNDSTEKRVWINSIREILKNEPVKITPIRKTDSITKINETPKVSFRHQQNDFKSKQSPRFPNTPNPSTQLLLDDTDICFNCNESHNIRPSLNNCNIMTSPINPPRMSFSDMMTSPFNPPSRMSFSNAMASPFNAPSQMSFSKNTVQMKISPKATPARSPTPIRYNSTIGWKYYDLRFSIGVFISFVIIFLLLQLFVI